MLGVSGTVSMKLSDGFSKLWPSIFIFIFYAASFVALTFAIKKIDISVAYTIWFGVGTALIPLDRYPLFQGGVNNAEIRRISLIIAGVVGHKVGSST